MIFRKAAKLLSCTDHIVNLKFRFVSSFGMLGKKLFVLLSTRINDEFASFIKLTSIFIKYELFLSFQILKLIQQFFSNKQRVKIHTFNTLGDIFLGSKNFLKEKYSQKIFAQIYLKIETNENLNNSN